jgi:glutamate racemase
VLIFDSGVGSLSIGAAIHDLLPEVELLYVMDHGGFPYGEWDEVLLTEHICSTVKDILSNHHIDLLVMACNSASTAVLPTLRSQITTPVVGVVPAIKPAAALSQSGVMGLLATPGTVSRPYTAQLIQDFAAHCQIIAVGSRELAPAVENHIWHKQELDTVLDKVTTAFRQHPDFMRMDTVVLACTHFPLIATELSRRMPNMNWVDSGQAIARRVAFLIEQLGFRTAQGKVAKQSVIVLGGAPISENLQHYLQGKNIHINAG